jgi:membrane protein required for colicin V production
VVIDLGWVDIGMAAFLALSVAVGLTRGFVFELLSLAGWFAAYFAALWFTPTFQDAVHVGARGSGLNYTLTFGGVFLLALVAWSLVARLIRALIRATPLSLFDRLLGAAFGLLRGLVVLLVVATLIDATAWRETSAWQRSQGAAWLKAALTEIRPFFTDDTTSPHPRA